MRFLLVNCPEVHIKLGIACLQISLDSPGRLFRIEQDQQPIWTQPSADLVLICRQIGLQIRQESLIRLASPLPVVDEQRAVVALRSVLGQRLRWVQSLAVDERLETN